MQALVSRLHGMLLRSRSTLVKTRLPAFLTGTIPVPIPFAVLAALLLACSCASIPRRSAAVNSVQVDGTSAVDQGDVEEKMATTSSPKFLGLFRGVVYDYEIFNQAVLATDLQRIK